MGQAEHQPLAGPSASANTMGKQLSLAWDKQGELTIVAPSSGSTNNKQARLRIRVQTTKKAIKRNKKKQVQRQGEKTKQVQRQGEKTKQVQQQGEKKKHLYVVLDDWDKGYSIHKLDDLESLRDPPLLRLEASKGSRDPRFVALGGGSKKMLALWQPRSVPTRATVYDVETGGLLADGPMLPPELHHVCSVAAAGGRLYALHAGGLHSLEEAPSPDFKPQWIWNSASTPPPFFGTPPNDSPIVITSYALHPDGHTFFVSARVFTPYGHTGTFSLDLDTTSGGGQWRRHGEWLLPFFGQGHYDSTLDAWVGFHSPGHLCACHVPPMVTSGEQPLEWTRIKAKDLFVADPNKSFWGDSYMTMTCMGNAEFCILEPLTTGGTCLLRAPCRSNNDSCPNKIDAYRTDDSYRNEYVLRLTKFRLKRNRRGQLRLSSRRLVRSYSLCKYDYLFAPQAFLI